MEIRFHKKFDKQFARLTPKQKELVIQKIEVFCNNPFESELKNHALRGNLKGERSFSVSCDLRVIFEEIDNYVLVMMLDIGSHNRVY